MQYAMIKITMHVTEVLPLRSIYTYSYCWIGSPHLPVIVCDEDQHLNALPWPLVKIEDRFEAKGGVYVRRDTGLWWLWYWGMYRARNVLLPIYYRLIYTAMIWGLARVDGRVPSWSDVYVLRWIAERMR